MIKAAVYNEQGEKVQDLELNPQLFDVAPSKALLEEAVRVQLANKRKTVSHTKTRAEVRGGGRKPWKQKGTGRARHGSIRSPLWAGGGITFGPRAARNWHRKINKAVLRKTIAMALTDKLQNDNFAILDNLSVDEPKTKSLTAKLDLIFSKANLPARNAIIVLPKTDLQILRIGRNLANVKIISASSLNLFDLLKADSVIVLRDAVPVIEKTYVRAGTKETVGLSLPQ